MKKELIVISSVLAFLFTSATCLADGQNFSGPSVGIKLGSSRNDVDYGGFLNGRSSSDNDLSTEIFGSYGFALSGSWVVGIGATYSLSKQDLGTENYLDGSNQESVRAEIDNHWSVYIEPGYKFTDQWLGFVKLSHHEADGDYRDSLLGNGSTNLNGTGYGIGVAYAYSNNIEARLEYQKVDFDRERVNTSTGEPEISEFSVSLGYRF